MRIFITGASGFVGRHIIPLLLQDQHELLILTRKANLQNVKQTVVGDLKNLNRIKKKIHRFDPQICLHLAWEGIPDFSYELSKRNFDHSVNLIQMLATETSCSKIIACGSAWEYGNVEGGCCEEDRVSMSSYFAWAKNSLHAWASLFCKERNIDFIWLRIFFAFGPGQKGHSLIPSLHDAFKNGRVPEIKNPMNAHDFIDVRDVAEAFREAVKTPIPSGIYNIGRGEPVTVSEICSMVEAQMKKFTDGNQNSPEGTSDSSVSNWADTSKLRCATTWRPLVSVQDGIKNYIEFLERQ